MHLLKFNRFNFIYIYKTREHLIIFIFNCISQYKIVNPTSRFWSYGEYPGEPGDGWKLSFWRYLVGETSCQVNNKGTVLGLY